MALMNFKRIAPVAAAPKPEPKPEEFIRTDSEPYPIMRNPNYDSPKVTAEVKIPKKLPERDDWLTLYNDSDSGVGYKVWSIERSGKTVTTRWGKEHAATMSRNDKTYITEREAHEVVRKTIATKRAKGYRENK